MSRTAEIPVKTPIKESKNDVFFIFSHLHMGIAVFPAINETMCLRVQFHYTINL